MQETLKLKSSGAGWGTVIEKKHSEKDICYSEMNINTCSHSFLMRFPEHSSRIIVQYNFSKSLVFLFFSSKNDIPLEYIYIEQHIIVVF